MSDDLVVWEQNLDGKYVCRVEQFAPYEGNLMIIEGDTILSQQVVTLAYQAIFGPDLADVTDWQERCMKFIDERNCPSSET